MSTRDVMTFDATARSALPRVLVGADGTRTRRGPVSNVDFDLPVLRFVRVGEPKNSEENQGFTAKAVRP